MANSSQPISGKANAAKQTKDTLFIDWTFNDGRTVTTPFDKATFGVEFGNPNGSQGIIDAQILNEGNADLVENVQRHTSNYIGSSEGDPRGWFRRVVGPRVTGFPAQFVGLPADVAQIPALAARGVAEGVGYLAERAGSLQSGVAGRGTPVPSRTGPAYPRFDEQVGKIQAFLSRYGGEGLRRKLEAATNYNVDLTPDARDSLERIVDFAMEFGLGGLESKGFVEGAGLVNTFMKVAREKARRTDPSDVTPETAQNLVERVVQSYRGASGKRQIGGETVFGTGMGVTYGTILEYMPPEFAESPLGQIMALATSLSVPAAAGKTLKYLTMTENPVVRATGVPVAMRWAKESILDPIFLPGTAASKAGIHAFSGMPSIRGEKNTRRSRARAAANVHRLMVAAFDQGREAVEGAGHLMHTTPSLVRAEGRIIENNIDQMERALNELEIERSTMSLDEYESRKKDLIDNIQTSKYDVQELNVFGNYMESLWQSGTAEADLGRMAAHLNEEVAKLGQTSDAFFEGIYDVFDSTVDDAILFGGRETPLSADGVVSPETTKALLDDYDNFSKDPASYLPIYEETRKRLVKENLREGQKINELSFIDDETAKGTQARLLEESEEALTEHFYETLDGLLRNAQNQQLKVEKHIREWLRDTKGMSWDEAMADPGLRGFISDYVTDIYRTAEDQWKALEESMWLRIDGFSDPVAPGGTIQFPENAQLKTNDFTVDASEMTPSALVEAVAENMTPAQRANPNEYFPARFWQISGWRNARDAAKSIEAKEIAALKEQQGLGTASEVKLREDRGIVAAERRLETAQRKLDLDIDDLNRRLEAEQKDAQAATTDLNSFVQGLMNRGAKGGDDEKAQAGLIRYLSNSLPTTSNWNSLKGPKAVADRRAWLDNIPQRIGDELGVPDISSRQPLELSEANATMLGNIVGDYRADLVIRGELSLDNAVGGVMRNLAPPKYVGSSGTWKTPTNYLEALIEKRTALDDIIVRKGGDNQTRVEKATFKRNAAQEEVENAVADVLRLDETDKKDLIRSLGILDTDPTPRAVQDIVSKLKADLRNNPKWSAEKRKMTGSIIEVLDSLNTTDNFPNLDYNALQLARATTNAARTVRDEVAKVLEKDPELRITQVLPVEKTSREVQTSSLLNMQTALARIPEDFSTFTRNEQTGRYEATLNPDLPFSDETLALYDYENFPFEKATFGEAGTYVETRLKPSFRTSRDPAVNGRNAALIEVALMDQLRKILPSERTLKGMGQGKYDIDPKTLEKFQATFREGIDFLALHGDETQKTFAQNLETLENVADVIQSVRSADNIKLRSHLEELERRGVIDPIHIEAFVQKRTVARELHNELESFQQTYGANAGYLTDVILEKALKSSQPATEIDNFLAPLLDDSSKLQGFRAALMNSVFRKILVPKKIPGARDNLAPAAPNVMGVVPNMASADEMAGLLQSDGFKTLIRKTYPDDPAQAERVLESLDKLVAGIGDVQTGRIKDINELQENWVNKELWTNFGRAVALAGAKSTGFINELYAAGAGGRIFREIGKKVTGNTIKDMLILMARDPQTAINFLSDVTKAQPSQKLRSDFLGMLYLMAKEDLLPTGMVNKLIRKRGAGAEAASEVGADDPEEAEQGFGPRASLQMEPSPVQVASAPRARPNTASVLNKSLFDYVSPALSNNQSGAINPETMAKGQQLFGEPGETVFANKGGIVSLRKKPRQMVL